MNAAPMHASPLVAALELAWRTMQAEWTSLPDAVVTIGSGTQTRGKKFHGRCSYERWTTADGVVLEEILMAGESFERGAEATFATLMHEAVHAWCKAKGIQDTSRQGRYHNKRFKKAAEGFGLSITEAPGIGWSTTELPGATARRYAAAIDGIREALTLTRVAEQHRIKAPAAQPDRNYLKCECNCGVPNVVRMSKAVWSMGIVRCDDCGELFDKSETEGR